MFSRFTSYICKKSSFEIWDGPTWRSLIKYSLLPNVENNPTNRNARVAFLMSTLHVIKSAQIITCKRAPLQHLAANSNLTCSKQRADGGSVSYVKEGGFPR